MYTVTVTDKSISLSGNGERFAVILTPTKKLEIHNSIEGKSAKHASEIASNIRKVITRKLSRRMSWADRMKKAGTFLAVAAEAHSLHTVNNRFNAILAEKFPEA